MLQVREQPFSCAWYRACLLGWICTVQIDPAQHLITAASDVDDLSVDEDDLDDLSVDEDDLDDLSVDEDYLDYLSVDYLDDPSFDDLSDLFEVWWVGGGVHRSERSELAILDTQHALHLFASDSDKIAAKARIKKLRDRFRYKLRDKSALFKVCLVLFSCLDVSVFVYLVFFFLTRGAWEGWHGWHARAFCAVVAVGGEWGNVFRYMSVT